MKIQTYVTGPVSVNTYLVWDEETNEGFVVDPGGICNSLVKDINNNNITVNYIILTHGHGDHIGGVEQLQKNFPGVKTLAHKDEVEMLTNARYNISREMFGKAIEFTPDVLVKGGDELSVGNMHLRFIHTPGHTKGGMCIYTDGVLFSGDTLFRLSVGRTDFHGGDFMALSKSIKNKLFELPEDTRVLPGHDRETTIAIEKKGNPFV